MTTKNKIAHQEPSTLVGIRLPGVYTRIFIDYLTDAQLTRLAFWLSSQKAGQVSAHRLNQIGQAVERRGLQLPATWQKLPFDNEAQQAAWGLWAARGAAKNSIKTGRLKKAKVKPAKKERK